MLIKEYRIPLPFTVEEYYIGQLFAVAEASKNETGGGEGVEVLKNEAFSNKPLLGNKYSSGQYTHKVYHLKKKVPTIMKLLAPKGSLELHEESWNAYPFCRTILTNPSYMKEGFSVVFESIHLPDRGYTENALELPEAILEHREVVRIDLANDPVMHADYTEKYDPKKLVSTKTNRGPFTGAWADTIQPVMTCYKYVSTELKWFGLQHRIESYMQKMSRRILTVFHRQVLCTMDDWIDLTIADIRKIEDDTKEDLDRARLHGSFRGTTDTNITT